MPPERSSAQKVKTGGFGCPGEDEREDGDGAMVV